MSQYISGGRGGKEGGGGMNACVSWGSFVLSRTEICCVVLQSVIILMYKNMGVPVYLSVCLSVCVNNIIWSHGDCCQLPFLL